MKHILAIALLIPSASDAQEYWHPAETGCYERPLWNTLLGWRDAPPMSPGAMRIAIEPDTGNGPTKLIQLDPGHEGLFSGPAVAPFILMAVGNRAKTCVSKLPLQSCPTAAAVLGRLQKQSIPLNFSIQSPSPITVMHGDEFYLEYEDGQYNRNQWKFYGIDHPLQSVIAKSMRQLESCLVPVEQSWHGR